MKGRLGVGLAIVVFALVTTGACTDSRGAEQPRQQTYGNAFLQRVIQAKKASGWPIEPCKQVAGLQSTNIRGSYSTLSPGLKTPSRGPGSNVLLVQRRRGHARKKSHKVNKWILIHRMAFPWLWKKKKKKKTLLAIMVTREGI